MDKLKHCPVCGCGAEVVTERYGVHVQCMVGGARTINVFASTRSKELCIDQAIAAWNIRAVQGRAK